jgi:hypothetical protein
VDLGAKKLIIPLKIYKVRTKSCKKYAPLSEKAVYLQAEKMK